MGFRRPKTRKGYELDEVVSALQKDCRRGDLEGAVTWARELLASGYGGYCWRRLFVIASEDVGIASNDVAVTVAALHHAAIATTEKSKPSGDDWKKAEMQLVHATLAIASARAKTRLCADLMIGQDIDEQRGLKRPIPEYALDAHTLAGRALGRRWGTRAALEFWRSHARVIVPSDVGVGNEFRDRLDALWDLGFSRFGAKVELDQETESNGEEASCG